MASRMNRKDWIKTSGSLLAGGLSVMMNPIKFTEHKKPRWNSKPSQSITFVSDEMVARTMPPEIKARLLANENPFGPSMKAKAAIREAIDNSYQYPFMMNRKFVEMIAKHEGLEADQISLTAGSSPILLAAAMYFSKEGGNIITGDPSYADLPEKAERFEAEIIQVPLTSEYKLDLDKMVSMITEETKLMYICNPNNPTGTMVDTQKLRSFCKRVSEKVPVFVDEAYIEYLDDPKASSMSGLVKEGYNLMVARTFSKLYGFAGLRVGYMLSNKEMAEGIGDLSRGSMSISATSMSAAIAAYNDTEFMDSARKKTLESKEFLYETLKQEGYDYVPSVTNFVIFPIMMEGERFAQELMKRGVGIRTWAFDNQYWCRVSVGTMPDMELFANAFKEIS